MQVMELNVLKAEKNSPTHGPIGSIKEKPVSKDGAQQHRVYYIVIVNCLYINVSFSSLKLLVFGLACVIYSYSVFMYRIFTFV